MIHDCRISSNKRRGYYSFHGAQSAATIRGRPLKRAPFNPVSRAGGKITCMLYNNHVIKEHRELPVYTGTAVLSTSPNSSFVSIKLFLVVVEV